MRLDNIHIFSCVFLTLGFFILSECAKRNLKDTLNELDDVKKNDSSIIEEVIDAKSEVEENTKDDPPAEEGLPILPPLILLDFNNDTIDANTTSEEKSKRTVNNGLGYGFQRNSLFSGKTNYYFPAGKTGTTVSIEESISPFLPRTIIEKYIPNNQNLKETNGFSNLRTSQANFGSNTKVQKATNYYDMFDSNYRRKNERSQFSTPPSVSSSTQLPQNNFDSKSSSYLLSNLNIPSYQSTKFNTDFNGQRGNIFRPTVQTYVERGQNVFQPTTTSTTQIDDSQIFGVDYTPHRSVSEQSSYFGLKQNDFRGISSPLSQSNRQSANYNDVNSQNYNKQNKVISTTPSSFDINSQSYRYLQNIFNPSANQQFYEGQRQNFGITSQDSLISNIPDFNDNKNNYRIYNDQRQNDRALFTTSSSVDGNYEFVKKSTTLANLPRYTVENGVQYENKIFWKYPDGRISHHPPVTYVETYIEDSTVGPKVSKLHESYIETSTENTANAQGPIQFPTAPELPSQENPFVSSDSLSSNLSHQQAYRIGYQNLVSQRPNVLLAQRAKMQLTAATVSSFVNTTPFPITKRPIFSNKNKQDRNHFSSSYTTTEKPVSRYMVDGPNAEYVDTAESSLKVKSGELSAHVLARYTTRVQNYLKKIFTANRDSGSKAKQNNKNLNDYNNLQYSDLLSYNPSISQYIKDPSSILNVRPTFVQAGNSLVPVIILRVDGTPPVQPKPTSNINLKALLQEYLIQYANSIKELAQPTNYELGAEQFSQTQRTIQAGNRLLQLARETQNENDDSSSLPSSSSSSSSSSFLSQSSYPVAKNYEENIFLTREEETRPIVKFGDRTHVRSKTKSVQIIDDQRYTA
ncbi:nuclear pore complex protein -like [Vespula squamosa]|uniref:Nuclear pore complex protein -like n=1 Tax=Vespula squamosa TaxID=30214 RepID=A0ABD2BHK2_VESSQ